MITLYSHSFVMNSSVLRFRQIQKSGPEVIKKCSCSTVLSMKFFLLINVIIPTIVGIITFMSGKISIQDLSEPKNSRIS